MEAATLTISNQIQCQGLDNRIIRTLKKDLTFDNPKYVDATKHGRFIGEEVPPYLKFFYKEYDDFVVPKGYLPILSSMLQKIGQEFKLNVLTIHGDKKPITFTGKLREYQEGAVSDVLRYPLGVVEARTGSGKTVCALAIIAKRQESTLIVVHSKELLHQWKDKIKEFLRIDCGMIGDGKFDLKHVTVGIINSVQRKKSKLRGKFSFLILDECLSPDTEILTDSGWKLIKDLNKTEHVAQWDIDGSISFVKPSKYIEKQFSGKLINIKGKHTDILATPTHQQPYLFTNNKIGNKSTCKKDIQHLPLWSYTSIPISGANSSNKKLTPYMRFSIMAQADGYLSPLTKKPYRIIQFKFSKRRKIDRFFQIMKLVKFPWKEIKPAPNARRFNVKAPITVNKNLTKIINLNDISVKFGNEFIAELLQWDGHTTSNVKYWSTTDKLNADFIQALCVLSGWKCSRTIQIDERSSKYNDIYKFLFWKKTHRGLQSATKFEVPYNGKVYCVRVPSGNIVIRRNNKVSITGNCHRSLAPTWIELITYMDCHYQLGLSATPFRRDDKMTKAIFYLIGPGIHRVDDEVLKNTGAILVPNIIKIGTFFQFDFRGDYSSMISSLVKDKRRNTIIYKGIKKELNTYGEQVLVVSERVGHCNEIAKLLKDGGVKVAVLTGSTKANDRKYIVRKMKQGDYEVLVSTVSLIGEGFDAPDLSAIFLCSPIRFKGRVIQTIGRILRPGKDKTAPRLYDIRDTHVDQLRWSGVARDRTYRSQGWNV